MDKSILYKAYLQGKSVGTYLMNDIPTKYKPQSFDDWCKKIYIKEDINFCTFPKKKLEKLIDFLGEIDTINNSPINEVYVNGHCISKTWTHNDNIIHVFPHKITIGNNSSEVMNLESYQKMVAIFDIF